MGLKSLYINKMWSQIIILSSSKPYHLPQWFWKTSMSLQLSSLYRYYCKKEIHLIYGVSLSSYRTQQFNLTQKMPLLCNHHMILGKEQIPPMLQTLVNQYTSRASSNTNSKAQPNDAFKSGKHNAKMKHCHLADKLLE